MPNQPATPARTVRISDEMWGHVKRVAQSRGEHASDIVRTAIERYLRDFGYEPED